MMVINVDPWNEYTDERTLVVGMSNALMYNLPHVLQMSFTEMGNMFRLNPAIELRVACCPECNALVRTDHLMGCRTNPKFRGSANWLSGYIKGVGTDEMADGLFDKYRVVNVETGEDVTEPVFVIKFSDKYAMEALTAYAADCSDYYPQLARDILCKLVDATDEKIRRDNDG